MPATPISTLATGKLNDTGITNCPSGCPVSGFPGQDAESGRDVTHKDSGDGYAGFSFTKISSAGQPLPASETYWDCVLDNTTGLIWEAKTFDKGLHDDNWSYSWYNPDSTQNGGSAGTQNGDSCGQTLSQCNTAAYVEAVNAEGWCGYHDWRLSTVNELSGLLSLDSARPKSLFSKKCPPIF